MTQQTWFLPPHFSFLPDAELALGTVISHPSRPTHALAVLSTDGASDAKHSIILPSITTISEADHRHSDVSKGSLGGRLFAKVVNLLSLSGSASLSHKKIKSLGTVDLEVRMFQRGLSAEALKQIVRLEPVKEHIDNCLYGSRPVYIVSGLRVAKTSFDVLYETSSAASTSAEVSGTAPVDAPLEVGANLTGNREKTRVDGFKTAPGIVYAYQLHAIRVKGKDNVSTELFTHRTAFLTGEGEDEDCEEEQEMESIEVNAEVMDDDMEVEVEFDQHDIGDSEACIVFKVDS